MTTTELLDQEKFKLSEIESEITAHNEQGNGLNAYSRQLVAQWEKLNKETIPAHDKRNEELHEAKHQTIGAIAMLERLAEQAQTASA